MRDKRRQVKTRFWDDNFISTLNPEEKLLFLYFLTSPLANICGVYEISIRRIIFDTALIDQKVRRIMKKFEDSGKVFFIEGWIYVKNFAKHQDTDNLKIRKGIENCVNALPKSIYDKIAEIENDFKNGKYETDDIETLFSFIEKDKKNGGEKKLVKKKDSLTISKEKVISPKEVAIQFFDNFINSEDGGWVKLLGDNWGKKIDVLDEKQRSAFLLEVNKFVNYWTELNKSGTKQRWELEKTFQVEGRLRTWMSNSRNFNMPRGTFGPRAAVI